MLCVSKLVAHQNTIRRDARVVEEARLESVYTCQRVSRVRIPIPPQKNKTRAQRGFCRSKVPLAIINPILFVEIGQIAS